MKTQTKNKEGSGSGEVALGATSNPSKWKKHKDNKKKERGPPHPKPSKPKQKNKPTKYATNTGKQTFLSHLQLNQIHNKRTTKRSKLEQKAQQHTNTTQPTIQNKTCKTTPKPKERLSHLEQPQFWVNFLFWCGLHPLFSAIAVFCWKHYRNSVFCKAQIVTPLVYTHSNSPLVEGVVHFPEGTKIHSFTSFNSFFVFFVDRQNPPKRPKQLWAPKVPFFFFEIIENWFF